MKIIVVRKSIGASLTSSNLVPRIEQVDASSMYNICMLMLVCETSIIIGNKVLPDCDKNYDGRAKYYDKAAR